jgi:hypothetical protein
MVSTFGFAFGSFEKALAKREMIAGFGLVPVAGQEGPTDLPSDGPADTEGGRSPRRVRAYSPSEVAK